MRKVDRAKDAKSRSRKAKDSASLKKLMTQATGTSVKKGDSILVKKQVTYAPNAQVFTQDLNSAAWNFYVTTKNMVHLQKTWAKRANEFYDSPEAMETCARLLYKTGSRAQAIEWMNKAISLKKARGFNTSESEAVVAKMQTNSVRIDSYQ